MCVSTWRLHYARSDEEYLINKHSRTSHQLSGQRAVEHQVNSEMGLGAIKESFYQFVWQQLLEAGQVRSKKVNERMLVNKFSDMTLFLHYFAQFCEPALKYMLLYMQRNKEGLFGQRIALKDVEASLKKLLVNK